MPGPPTHVTPPPPPPVGSEPPRERTLAGVLVPVLVVGGVVLTALAGAGALVAWLILAPNQMSEESVPVAVAPAVAGAVDTGSPSADVPAAASENAAEAEAGEGEPGDEDAGEDEAGGEDLDGEAGEGVPPDEGAEAGGDGPAPPAATAGATPKPPASCDVKSVSRRSNGAAVVKKSTLEKYVRNPDKVSNLGSFSWKRHKKSKDIRGVRMRRMPCPGMMRAAGLRNGDVVLSVNGTPATSIARGMVIWGNVKATGKARMKVKHGSEGTRTVTVYVVD